MVLYTIEFHKINAEMNKKIGSCLQEKADLLSQSLSAGESESIDEEGYQNMVGNLSADFPNCPAGSSSGGGSRSSNGGEGETKIEVGDMELETTSDVTDTKMRKAKSGIGQTTMNLSEKEQLEELTTLLMLRVVSANPEILSLHKL